MTIAWTDPEIVLAISRAGTLTGAAEALKIDHSTAFRRLRGLERTLGMQLFERSQGGKYQATAAGERIALAAERMEEEVRTLDRDLAGGDLRLTGRLRITSSESLAFRLLPPQLSAFRKAHPGIGVDLILDNRLLDLSRREADVALRTVRPKEGELWGRKLATIAWAVYGARSYLSGQRDRPVSKRLGGHSIIGWDDSSRRIPAAEWVEENASANAINYRTASLINQCAAARCGLGLAVLPCYLGDVEPGLVRAIPEPIRELEDELWIIAHLKMKDAVRVRAFFDLVGGGLASQRDLIGGRSPRSARSVPS